MSIIGIITIFILPYMAGYILKVFLNRRETSQIETYLTGFFFVFLLQGLVYLCTVTMLGGNLDCLFLAYTVMTAIIMAAFVALFIINYIRKIRDEKIFKFGRPVFVKEEVILLFITLLVAALVVIKIFVLESYLRRDLMLATIRTTLSTGTIYEYNPITSRPFVLGLIGSKKIISLPIYYSYLCKFWGIDASRLLYIVLTIQTILCTYFSCVMFITPIFKNRKKLLIFTIFLGFLILSGDYFDASVCSKLCWKGYSGEAIVPCVIIPFVMYIITDGYRINVQRRSLKIDSLVFLRLFQMLICITCSLFITGITSGVLLIALTIVVFIFCCIYRYRKEQRGAHE